MSLNVTNAKTLIKSFGAESDDWLGGEIEISVGLTEYEGEETATLLVRVISAEVEQKKAVTPQKKKTNPDMDPF
jgi:hypothetical protein